MNENTIQVFFRVAGSEIWHGDTARQVLARAGGEGLPSRLFHYGSGKPCQGAPAVRFLGGRGGFSLLGFGTEAIETIESSMAAIARRVHGLTGAAVTIDPRYIETRAEPIPYRREYCIRRLVVQKKPRHAARLDNEEAISALIQRGIEDHIRLLNLPDRTFEITATGWKEGKPVPIGHNSGGFVATLRDVRFEIDAKLHGWWGAGHLRARGYGNFHADFQNAREVA